MLSNVSLGRSLGHSTDPVNMVFDGLNHLWIGIPGHLYTVSIQNGTVGDAFFTGVVSGSSIGLVFDGTSVNAASLNSDGIGGVSGVFLAVFSPTTLGATGHFAAGFTNSNYYGSITPVAPQIRGMTFDGTNYWFTDYANWVLGKVTLSGNTITASAFGGSNFIPGLRGPSAMAFDGSNIWLANQGGSNVAYNSTTINVADTPDALAFDGANMWVALASTNQVTKLSYIHQTFTVGTTPSALSFDGTNMWVANSGNNTLTVITPPQ